MSATPGYFASSPPGDLDGVGLMAPPVGASLDIRPLLKQVGRGNIGARSLTRTDMQVLFGAMLDGSIPDLELGGLLVAFRMKGESLDDWPSKSFSGSFKEGMEMMLLNNKIFINFVDEMAEAKLSEHFTYINVEGKTFSNPVWESVHHCMNHSAYHRGQIVTMLRQLGITTIPSTDFIVYCRLAGASI